MIVRLVGAAALASLLAGCVAEDNYAYTPPQQSCYRHDPLTYTPILTRINVTANYTLKEPDKFYGYENQYFFEELDDLNPGKYKLADGVIPNLILTITISNDGQDHYGAYMEGHGNGEGFLFSYTWDQIYVTAQRLREDIADKVNAFITLGWHRGNC
jgi:hypothetical protein